MNDDYKKLKTFWDKNFILTEEAKKEILEYDRDTDYKVLAPSEKLIIACNELGSKNKVLDYGAGFGFASIIAKRAGAKEVIAFDTSKNACDLALYYADYFKADINYVASDEKWLLNEEDNKYDGIICSNVLDVLPLDVSKNIMKNLARVAKCDALIIIGLNYYVDVNKIPPKDGKKTNLLYIDGILRLLSLTDEEWANLFKDYFEVVKLEHFSWQGEEKELRRLFFLKKKVA